MLATVLAIIEMELQHVEQENPPGSFAVALLLLGVVAVVLGGALVP